MTVVKWMTATAVAALALGAAACGGSGSDSSSASGGKKMTLVVGSEADAFYKALECGAKTEAKRLGVQIDLQGPKAFDASLQTPIVNSAAAKRPDALLIAPTDSKALYPAVRQAKDNGAKIVTVDTQLDNQDIVSASVRSDFREAGVEGAKELNRLLNGKGKVLLISSPPGVTTSDLSREGFTAELKKYPGIKLVATQFSNGEPGKSASITSATLARTPDLGGIFTFNGGDAEGVVTALREAGKTKAVKFISGDAQPFQVEQLRKGEVTALIAHKPYDIGVQGVRQAMAAIEGKKTTPVVQTSLVVARGADVDNPAVKKFFYRPC
jgi:ribose transport system substrate-binding protein